MPFPLIWGIFMKPKFILILVLFMLLFLVSCSNDMEIVDPPNNDHIPVEEEPVVVDEPTPEELFEEEIKKYISSLTMDEKVGQLIIVGFDGMNITPREIQLIKDYNIGGFILFQRNISDYNGTVELILSLNSENERSYPLFLGIDEEGGDVSRLSMIYRNFPTMSKLGEKNDLDLSYQFGYLQGLKLTSLGFNVNFAPVLDVNSNPNNPVIGHRALHKDPEIVKNNGIKIIKGLLDAGIVPVAKHFPGHGDTAIDSHIDLAKVEKSLEDLKEIELVPFSATIDEGLPGIMIGHILLSRLSEKPATLSKEIIEDLLRDDLGYDGLVFSDDMTMGAITNYNEIQEASLQFLISSGDLLLICHGVENPFIVINRIKEGIINGEIPIEKIDEKLFRIYKAKNMLMNSHMEIEKLELEEKIQIFLEKFN